MVGNVYWKKIMKDNLIARAMRERLFKTRYVPPGTYIGQLIVPTVPVEYVKIDFVLGDDIK